MTGPAPVPARSREHHLILVGALLALLGLVAVGALLTPDPRGFGTHEQLGFRACLPIRLWNVPCPGCGVTTSVALLVHGHPLSALRTQPFGWVTVACVLAFALFALRTHRRGGDLAAALPGLPWRWLAPTLVVLCGASWLYKLALVRGWFA